MRPHHGGLVVSAMIQKIGTTNDEPEIRIAADRVVLKVVPPRRRAARSHPT